VTWDLVPDDKTRVGVGTVEPDPPGNPPSAQPERWCFVRPDEKTGETGSRWVMDARPFSPEALILEMPAEQALAWVIGEPIVPRQFHWHGLAEGAAFRATTEDGPDRATWAKVALAAYTFLIRYSGELTGNTFEQSAMMVKTNMIAYGIADPAWTVEGVIDWFRRAALMTIEQAEQRIAELDAEIKAAPKDARSRSPSIHQKLFTLRKLRNKIYTLICLSKCKGVTLPADIQAWIELQPRLP
jgi:hypothetical protein